MTAYEDRFVPRKFFTKLKDIGQLPNLIESALSLRSLTFRNPRLQPETHDACRKSGCMAPDEPACAVGNPVDFAALDGKPACEQFPIGWCQGP